MRYIGSKASTVTQISAAIDPGKHRYTSLCDPFAGTCTVARHFKALGLRVVTGDLLRQSYVFQTVYVQLSRPPTFDRLRDRFKSLNVASPNGKPAQAVLGYLNNLSGKSGFITKNYSPAGPCGRQFFTITNARRIDRVRCALDLWQKEQLIDGTEESYLIAALLEATDRVANTAGTYYAYLKTFYRKALKQFQLEPPRVFGNRNRNSANQVDALQLVRKSNTDILYLDPPYNGRDYGAYYHLPETLALGIKPQVHGRSGVPDRPPTPRSSFCNPATASMALEQIVDATKSRCLVFHYSPNGVLAHKAILRLLSDRGPTTSSLIPVRRYSSHHELGEKGATYTRLYICRAR